MHNRTLNEFLDCSVDKKINLIKQLLDALYCLHQLSYDYFALAPYMISVDDNENLMINCMFLSNYRLLSRGCSEFLEFVDEELLAPEILLLKRCFSDEVANKISYGSSEVFSIGMLILYLFRHQVNFTALQLSTINPVTYVLLIINQLDRSDVEDSDAIEAEKGEGFIREIVTTQLNRLENEAIKKVCYNALKVDRRQRASLAQLMGYLDMEPSYQLISAIPFYKVVTDFEKLVEIASLRNRPPSRIEEFLDKILEEHIITLTTAHDSYLFSKCNSKNNQGATGILYFLYNLLRDLKIETHLTSFCNVIPSTKKMNYKERFNLIITCDIILQDYLLMGLFLFDIERDWKFFFPSVITERNYCKLSSFTKMYEQFEKFFQKPSIKEILIGFKDSERTYEDLILNKILPNVYVLDTQPSLYGLTTYGLNIFIRDFVKGKSGKLLKEMGAMLATLFHEVAHALRRISCETRLNAKVLLTPKDGNSLKDFRVEEKTEKELSDLRGEAGFSVEEQLFGYRLTSINDRSADVLLGHSMNNLSDFQRHFLELNSSQVDSIYLGRSENEFFTNRKCGLSGQWAKQSDNFID